MNSEVLIQLHPKLAQIWPIFDFCGADGGRGSWRNLHKTTNFCENYIPHNIYLHSNVQVGDNPRPLRVLFINSRVMRADIGGSPLPPHHTQANNAQSDKNSENDHTYHIAVRISVLNMLSST